jgi:hypothetical protein
VKALFAVVAIVLSGCAAGPLPEAYYPKPLTKAEVRAEWARDYLAARCHLDAGAYFALCLSDDAECCRYMASNTLDK